ncbi:MAG: peptidase, partial [Spirochaetales bacterium]|nr:peptidase [Spirochaetales bacterium]
MNASFGFFYVWIALLFITIILILTNIRIVQQSNAVVIERLGTYLKTWNVGIHVKVPFIDSCLPPISHKEKVLDFP